MNLRKYLLCSVIIIIMASCSDDHDNFHLGKWTSLQENDLILNIGKEKINSIDNGKEYGPYKYTVIEFGRNNSDNPYKELKINIGKNKSAKIVFISQDNNEMIIKEYRPNGEFKQDNRLKKLID